MTPTPEQIEKAGYWFNKNIRARKTVEQLSTAYVLAAYAAHCVAEAVAEKDAEIARLRAVLNAARQYAIYVEPLATAAGLASLKDAINAYGRAALQETKP